jgi:hypothetical protein
MSRTWSQYGDRVARRNGELADAIHHEAGELNYRETVE